MNEILDLISGMDKRKEILDLWYEVTYLRILFNHMLTCKPCIASHFDHNIIESCKIAAQNILKEKFAMHKLDFLTPEEAEDRRKKSEASLREFLTT